MELKTKAYKPFTKDEVSIRRDVVFRMVFGDNYRSEYLKELLESLLHKKITNIVIRNDVAIDKVHGDDKAMRLDILAEIDGKEKVNVEFQNKNEYNVIERGEETVKKIKTPEEQWLAYLSHSLSKEEEGELFKMNRSIEEINKIVDIVMTEQDVRDALNDRILAENLEYLKKKKAYEDGEEHGKAENTLQIVKEMLSKNMDDKIIMEITKISEEELKQLKNTQQR